MLMIKLGFWVNFYMAHSQYKMALLSLWFSLNKKLHNYTILSSIFLKNFSFVSHTVLHNNHNPSTDLLDHSIPWFISSFTSIVKQKHQSFHSNSSILFHNTLSNRYHIHIQHRWNGDYADETDDHTDDTDDCKNDEANWWRRQRRRSTPMDARWPQGMSRATAIDVKLNLI